MYRCWKPFSSRVRTLPEGVTKGQKGKVVQNFCKSDRNYKPRTQVGWEENFIKEEVDASEENRNQFTGGTHEVEEQL